MKNRRNRKRLKSNKETYVEKFTHSDKKLSSETDDWPYKG